MPVLSIAIDARAAKIGATQADQAFKKVKGSANSAASSVRNFDLRAKGLGATLRGVLGPLSSFFGVFTAALIARQTIKIVSDFEDSIVTLGAVARASAEQLEILEITARRFGATTRFSASEAADGLLFLARAGFSVGESIEALPSTLDLAITGVLDLGNAANIASNVLKGFGLEVSATSKVVDNMVNVANRANVTVQSLADAFVDVAPIAKKMGQSMEETASQIGVLGDAGIPASKAGIALRGILLSLSIAAPKATKAFKSLGLNLEEFKDQGLSTTEILRKLTDAGADLTDLAAIFGRRFAGAASVIGLAADKVGLLTKAQKENIGAAAEQAKVMRDTLGGSLKELSSIAQELILTIGDSGLGGAFKNFIEAISDGIKFIVGLQDGFKGTAQRAAQVAAGLKLIVVIFGSLIALKTIGFVSNLAIGMFQLAKASSAVAIATSPLITIFAVLGAILAGIEIGRFITSEFKIAAQGAAAFAEGFLIIVEKIKFSWRAGIISLKLAWVGFTDFLKEKFVSSINEIVAVARVLETSFPKAAKILGLKGAATGFKILANGIRAEGKKTSAELISQLALVGVKSEATIKGIKDAGTAAFVKINKEFGSKSSKGQNFGTFILDDIKKAVFEMDGLNVSTNLNSKINLDINTTFKDNLKLLKEAKEEVDKNTDAADKLKAKMDLVNGAVRSITSSLTDGIFDAITGADKLSNILRTTARQISQQIAKQAISSAISAGLGSLIGGFAGGGGGGTIGGGSGSTAGSDAFGNVKLPFHNGGVISSRSTFPMAGGQTGLMSEAGPEAILPLVRRKGKLSVAASGGSGGGVTNNINFNVTTPDANSFRESRTQILQDLRSGLGGAL